MWFAGWTSGAVCCGCAVHGKTNSWRRSTNAKAPRDTDGTDNGPKRRGEIAPPARRRMTSSEDDELALAQHFLGPGDAEDPLDELENQRGWRLVTRGDHRGVLLLTLAAIEQRLRDPITDFDSARAPGLVGTLLPASICVDFFIKCESLLDLP